MKGGKDMVRLAERLMKGLPPERNRQPAIAGDSWMIHWRPDASRGDRLCVGVAFSLDGAVTVKLVDDEDLDRFSAWLSPAQRAQIGTLLDAVDLRLRSGNLTPPIGISYETPKEARGNSIPEVIAMLWRYGPGLMVAPKPATTGLPEQPMAKSRRKQST